MDTIKNTACVKGAGPVQRRPQVLTRCIVEATELLELNFVDLEYCLAVPWPRSGTILAMSFGRTRDGFPSRGLHSANRRAMDAREPYASRDKKCAIQK